MIPRGDASAANPSRLLPCLAFCLALLATGARPASAHDDMVPTWGDVFAAEHDTVLFVLDGGRLWRAPFDLASRDTLWSRRADEHVVRVALSPDGRRAGWLARAEDQDSTDLWLADLGPGAGPPRLGARFQALRPSQFGSTYYEAHVPTNKDPAPHGVRWIASSVTLLRGSSNTLAWTSGGEALVFGDADGIAELTPDDASVLRLSHALAIELRGLGAAPMQLVSGIVPVEGHAERAWLVAFTLGGRWRLFGAAGFTRAREWTSSATRLWWVEGKRVRVTRADDPKMRTEVEADAPIVWIRCEPGRESLWWAAGRNVRVHEVEGDRVALSTSTPIRAVLEAEGGRAFAAITKDSLCWIIPPTPGARGVALDGDAPERLFVGAGGEVVIARRAGGVRHGLRLSRLDATRGVLVPLEAPIPGDALVATSPGGSCLMLCAASAKPPETFQVYRFAIGNWVKVPNPGILAWEVLKPRER